MPSAQKPAVAEGAERALSRDQPAAAEAAVPTPANKGSASAAGAEVIHDSDHEEYLPGAIIGQSFRSTGSRLTAEPAKQPDRTARPRIRQAFVRPDPL